MQRFRLVVRGRAAAAAAAVARRQGGQRRNGEEYDASRLRYPHVGSPFSFPAASGRSPLSTRRERNPSFRWWTASLRSEEHTSELQSLIRISYAVFCLKTKK